MEALLRTSWWRFLVLCALFLVVFLGTAQLLSDGTISDATLQQALELAGAAGVGWGLRGRYRDAWDGKERRIPQGGRG